MRALRCWVAVAGTSWLLLSPARAWSQQAQLDSAMARALQEEGLVGVVWATVRPDGTIATGAAGLSDARRGEPLTPESRVQIGSVAKTLIAAGVLRLVTEGRLTLDTPVTSLLPALTFENPWTAEPIRVRHLLDHTSGLDDARLWQVFSLEARPDTPLSASVERDPSLLRVRSRPGARLSYSNMGYTLLGMVIEAVAGERYETYLDAHLLRPLGMHRSSFQFISQTGAQADPRLAMGHFENGATQPAVAAWLRPAGQFTTTAADMALLARFLMGNGEIEGVPFIDQQLLRNMSRPSTTEAVTAGLEAGYGLGLSRRDRHGVVGRCHVGTTVGYRANLCLFPEEQKAFIVSMNADTETADYERFDVLLIRALGVKAAERSTPAHPPAGIAEWEGIYALVPNRMESFAYLDLALNFATVRWDGVQLHLKPFQASARSLTPTGGMLLRSNDRTADSHALLTTADGTPVITDGFRSYEKISVWRIGLVWASLAVGVLGLVYLLVAGLVRLSRRSLRPKRAIFVPFMATMALGIPIPLLLAQSFLQLGDLTPASAALAIVTGVLPLAMIVGLCRAVREGAAGRHAVLDMVAMVAVLQWTIVLAVWGLVPLRLWA